MKPTPEGKEGPALVAEGDAPSPEAQTPSAPNGRGTAMPSVPGGKERRSAPEAQDSMPRSGKSPELNLAAEGSGPNHKRASDVETGPCPKVTPEARNNVSTPGRSDCGDTSLEHGPHSLARLLTVAVNNLAVKGIVPSHRGERNG